MNEASIENTLKDISKTLKAIQKDLHKLILQDPPQAGERRKERT